MAARGEDKESHLGEKLIKGIAASPGVAMGKNAFDGNPLVG